MSAATKINGLRPYALSQIRSTGTLVVILGPQGVGEYVVGRLTPASFIRLILRSNLVFAGSS